MAITSITEKQFVSSSVSNESRTFEVSYLVISDSKSDGLTTIGEQPEFRLGKEYSFNGDSDPEAYLESFEVDAEEEGYGLVFTVNCTFVASVQGGGPPSAPGGGSDGESGAPPTAPGQESEWAWELFPIAFSEPAIGEFEKSVSYQPGFSPCDKEGEIFITDRLGDLGIGEDYVGPILNSAWMPVDPAYDVEKFGIVIRRHRPVLEITNEDFEAVGTLNSLPFRVTVGSFEYPVFTKLFEPRSLRINNLTSRRIGDWDTSTIVTWEMQYNPCGWFIKDLDQGRGQVPLGGGADGGTVFERDIADIEPIVGDDGREIVDNVLLNGKGRPLSSTESPVFNLWKVHDETDFNQLNIL